MGQVHGQGEQAPLQPDIHSSTNLGGWEGRIPSKRGCGAHAAPRLFVFDVFGKFLEMNSWSLRIELVKKRRKKNTQESVTCLVESLTWFFLITYMHWLGAFYYFLHQAP